MVSRALCCRQMSIDLVVVGSNRVVQHVIAVNVVALLGFLAKEDEIHSIN